MSYNPLNDDPIFDDDGAILREPEPRFPCLYLTIDPGSEGYDQGYRFRVDQIDGEMHYFADRERAVHFILREALDLVDYEKMLRLREEAGIEFRYFDE